jgi:hypothetical protein
MPTFSEANQARLSLKMQLSRHAWYNSTSVVTVDDGFGVIIGVKHVDNSVRKLIPPVVGNVSVKTEVE